MLFGFALTAWLLFFQERPDLPTDEGAGTGQERRAVGDTEPAVQAFAVSRAAVKDEGELAELPAGSLLILETRWRTVPGGTVWYFESRTKGLEREIVLDGAPVELPAGTWSVDARTEGWRASVDSVHVETARTTTLWVGEASELEVEVVDLGGAAVAGARVRWAPPHQRASEQDVLAVTDDLGIATLALPLGPVGRVSVFAEGYVPAMQPLHGPTERLRITLHFDGGDALASPVTIVDADTGTGIPGAVARVSRVPWSASADAGGVLLVPSGLPRNCDLDLRAEGYCSANLPVEEAVALRAVPLFPAVRRTFSVVDVGGEEVQDATILLSVRSPSAEVPPRFGEKVGTAVPVALPASVTILAQAFDQDGRSGVEEIPAGAPETTVEIEIGSGESLTIHLVDDRGAVIREARAEVTYRREQAAFPARNSTLRIPAPDAIDAVYVTAPGHADVRLHPRPGASRPRSGQLRLVLGPAYELEVRVLDARGRAAPGMDVRAWPRADLDVFRTYPELNGGWPTDHPEWVQHPPRALPRTTDPQGTCHLSGLRAGDYTVAVDLPHALDPDLQTLLPRVSEDVTVPLLREVTITVPCPKRVRLFVFDELTGLPVRDVTVTNEKGDVRAATLQNGTNYWEGIVALPEAVFVVRSPGYRPHTLRVDAEDDIARDVYLLRQAPMLLRFDGLPSPGPQNLQVGVLRKVRAQDGQGLFNEQVWSGTVRFDGHTLPLSLPFTDDFIVKLAPLIVDGETWEPEPSLFYLRSGSELGVRVERSR